MKEDLLNRSFSRFYGRVCNLTSLQNLSGESAGYKNRTSANAQKVRGSLFLAAMLHHANYTAQSSGFFLCLKAAKGIAMIYFTPIIQKNIFLIPADGAVSAPFPLLKILLSMDIVPQILGNT